jgi:hypothetical protein
MKLNRMIQSIFAAMALMPLIAMAAPAEKSNPGLLRQEVKQNNISISLKRVALQLDSVIAEYHRNGLEGDDVDMLRRFRSMLDRLTSAEVAAVVKKLQAAQLVNADPKATSKNALAAFSGQKQVVFALNQIYDDWQSQQGFRLISTRFERLAKTQHSNLQRAVEMGAKSRDSNSYRYSESDKIDLRIQELDQEGINEEAASLGTLLGKLDKKFKGTKEQRAEKALAEVKSTLQPALDRALNDLKTLNDLENKPIKSAASNEHSAYRSMKQLVRILAPERSREEIIRQAIEDIKRVMDEQTKVMVETKKLKDARVPDAESLDRAQRELVFQTDLIREDVSGVVPKAADELKESLDNQQTVRLILNNTRATPDDKAQQAPEQQELALGNLADAKSILEKKLLEMNEQKYDSAKGSKLEELEKALVTVGELIDAEEAIRDETVKVSEMADPTEAQKGAANEVRQQLDGSIKNVRQLVRHLEGLPFEEIRLMPPQIKLLEKDVERKIKDLKEADKKGQVNAQKEFNEALGQLRQAFEATGQAAKAAEQAEVPNSPNLADRIAKGAEEQAGASGKNRDQFKKPLDDELKKLAEEIRDERKEEPQGDQVEFDDQQAYKFWYILKELPSSTLQQKSHAEKFMLLLAEKKLKPEQVEAARKQAIEELKKMEVEK